MCKLINLSGEKYGKLTALSVAGKSSSGNVKWLCKCDCGKEGVVVGSKLRNGHTKSCGCLRMSNLAQGHSASRLYRIWVNMHNRCYNRRHDAFKWYGKKGVSICDEWQEFMPFRIWALENGYDDSLSIDRINGELNYCPENCRWQTQKQQMNNVSSNHIIEYNGERYTMVEFSEFFNINYWTVNNRLRSGWDIEKILSVPESV